MEPIVFIKTYKKSALEAEKLTGLSYKANLSQGAWESGWGKSAPGNNLFGVKDNDGINGNEQLLTTTEYSKSKTLKFPQIISITWDNSKKLWKYKIKDWFRKYPDTSELFTEHAKWFQARPRYAKAWTFRNDPYRFFEEIAKAGYATDPNYAKNLSKVCDLITKIEKANNI